MKGFRIETQFLKQNGVRTDFLDGIKLNYQFTLKMKYINEDTKEEYQFEKTVSTKDDPTNSDIEELIAQLITDVNERVLKQIPE